MGGTKVNSSFYGKRFLSAITSARHMKYLISIILLFSALCASQVSAQTKQKVHVIEISGEVDLGMASYVEHAAASAEKDNAVILLHVNTFGGRVDAATRIRD